MLKIHIPKFGKDHNSAVAYKYKSKCDMVILVKEMQKIEWE